MTARVIEPTFARSGPPVLAARFADYLGQVRRRLELPTGLVTAQRPTPPDLAGGGLVPVGHLVAMTAEAGHVRDTVVWELLPEAAYTDWLAGAPAPDRAALDAALPGLLRLRALHRGGQLRERNLTDLAGLLDGRYLSARIAHRHADLVLPIAAQIAAHPPSPPYSRPTELYR